MIGRTSGTKKDLTRAASDESKRGRHSPTAMKAIVALLALVLAHHAAAQTIHCPAGAPAIVRLAAKEVRRYVYLRTGDWLPMGNAGPGIALRIDSALGPEEWRLRTSANTLTISGGSDVAVLYGAYAFAEKLGVRFYLHGDVVPDGRIPFRLPVLDETHRPLFEHRGIQPFHDFPEGPDWWSRDDYLVHLGQLARMRMNFLGLHCYPEGGVGPEPLVWIGLTNDLAKDGRVKRSYPAFWANTAKGTWGYAPMRTSEFAGGAHQLFAADDYGPEAMAGLMPRPVTPEQCNAVFDRVGSQMKAVFAQARRLGIKTCVGTETPLMIPRALRDYLQSRGLDPEHTNTVRALYTGVFRRVAEVYGVDYYWLWTPEEWTWGGNKPGQLEAAIRDIQLALGALHDLGAPFTLATSGWVLGPAHNRAALDEFLPKTSPMSCINRQVGHEGVEPAFANVRGRPKWAIPWMENDPNMVGAQPWVARMRYDAVDARRFGCTGLLGIHWRTRALAPNVAALAAAAWDQSYVPAGFDMSPVADDGAGRLGGGARPPSPRDRAMPIEDFYVDFARAHFGEAVAESAGKLMASVDGVRMPAASDWKNGPGNLVASPAPWREVQPRYAFVEAFAALRPRVSGAGNLERFDYWLRSWQAMAAMAEVCCLRGQLDAAMAAKSYAAALVHRIELACGWSRLLTLHTALASTPGELGTIANLEQHTRRESHFLDEHDGALRQALGAPLPPEVAPSQQYTGPARLVVPTVRSLVRKGESLQLTILAPGQNPVEPVTVKLRSLGTTRWRSIAAAHVGRAVYRATLPAARHDFEYYVLDGRRLVWPATAPFLNQTVVVMPE